MDNKVTQMLLEHMSCYKGIKIFVQMKILQQILVHDFKQQLQNEYNSVLTQITAILTQVNTNLRHIFRGIVVWYPRYKQVRSDKRPSFQLTKYRSRDK